VRPGHDQRVNRMRSDKARAARDQNPHNNFSRASSCFRMTATRASRGSIHDKSLALAVPA
jgi:hypothetical protein